VKILLLGKNGQVGWELQRTLAPLGKLIAIDQEDLDLINTRAIRRAVRSVKPDLIVNAAAYTAVDKAEEEADLAMAINGVAPGILAEEAGLCRAALVHYSTDYVFDGKGKIPYSENDKPNPLNTYGKTKLEGDKLIQEKDLPHLVFRTSWVYGLRGSNFLLTILRLAQEKEELSVINDQFGAPTWSRMIAEATALVVSKGIKDIYAYTDKNRGIYNLSAAGKTTWHQFAEKILQLTDSSALKCKRIIPISSSEYETQARRPGFSVLDNSRLYKQFDIKLPAWESSLELVLSEYQYHS
jgi:dTDP-4-dehydrorhamnose reductase